MKKTKDAFHAESQNLEIQDHLSVDKKFALDVYKGLSSKPKYLNSKYFYDAEGDKLFQQIMALDEYYPTDCEFEILHKNKNHLLKLFSDSNTPFLLTELGAGDGMKTKILLRHFQQTEVPFSYLPIDISGNVLKNLKKDLSYQIPGLRVKTYAGEYFHALDQLNRQEQGRKVLLFLGSTIGNFNYPDAIEFLKALHERMNSKDWLVIGFDLKKDPTTILRAYNDAYGITSRFNLNLLHRINRELDGEFLPERFYHYPTYNPLTGETKSFLISKTTQTVRINTLGTAFDFEEGEPIYMEISQKYDEEMIADLADKTGFRVQQNFLDNRAFFVDSLWQKK